MNTEFTAATMHELARSTDEARVSNRRAKIIKAVEAAAADGRFYVEVPVGDADRLWLEPLGFTVSSSQTRDGSVTGVSWEWPKGGR